MTKPKTKSRSKQTLYPALAAWHARNEQRGKYGTWSFDALWRAACAEAEARQNQNNPQREQQYQREAIAALLGDEKVKLDTVTVRRYLARIKELTRKAKAA